MFETQLRIRALAFAGAAAAFVGILMLLVAGGSDIRASLSDPVVGGSALAAAAAVFLAAHLAFAPFISAIERVTQSVRPRHEDEGAPPIPDDVRARLPKLVAAIELFKKRVLAEIETIERTAHRDPITDLPNRQSFRRTVERYLRRLRSSESQCALLFIDLDRFKSVNDSLGHAQGDVLLAMFAARMRVLMAAEAERHHGSSEPVLARHGGDEFTMFIPNLSDPLDAKKLGRRVLRALQEPFEIAGQSIVIGASIGICYAPRDGDDFETLMRNVDTAMYHAKDMGRNQVHMFEAEMHERVRDRLRLETQLRSAIPSGQLELFLQPQIRSDSGQLVSAEALIRWRHPDLGLCSPAAFIDIAEDSGLIVELGRWVIEDAVRIVSDWARQGRQLRLSINVSPQQIERADFVQHLRDRLDASNAPTHMLEFEITESTVMSSDPAIVDKLAEVRSFGIPIAIDDFGTGYSNLARLKDLPIDRLKIDRSLVKDVATSADARTIIQAIVSLANGLGYECVAEGVETEVEADILGVIGCEILQGYWISKPIALAEFEHWAEARSVRTNLLGPTH
jgi:diguanylate cyclase (GGDEF)-like protein